jgi:hypothetical protein
MIAKSTAIKGRGGRSGGRGQGGRSYLGRSAPCPSGLRSSEGDLIVAQKWHRPREGQWGRAGLQGTQAKFRRHGIPMDAFRLCSAA